MCVCVFAREILAPGFGGGGGGGVLFKYFLPEMYVVNVTYL